MTAAAGRLLAKAGRAWRGLRAPGARNDRLCLCLFGGIATAILAAAWTWALRADGLSGGVKLTLLVASPFPLGFAALCVHLGLRRRE
jgi:hypothetical protein